MALLLLRVPCLTSTPTTTTTTHKPYSKSSSCRPHSSIHFLPLSLTLTHNKKINIRFAASTSEQQTTVKLDIEEEEEEQVELSQTRLLARNVPWTSTPEDIRSLFQRYGKVIEVELSMYNKSRNRGLAFVEMGSPEEALAALNSLESYEYEGRVINITYARPKREKTRPPVQQKQITFNLFVANLSYDTRSKDLKEFFDSGTGRVVSAEVIFNENPRRSAGYGFVSFDSKKEANEALSEFQGKSLKGRAIRVAPSNRFVQSAEESARSEDTSSELSVNEAEADKAD